MADYRRPFVQRTNERLNALELRLRSGATIRADQAAEIALAVKNVALLLTGRATPTGLGGSGANDTGAFGWGPTAICRPCGSKKRWRGYASGRGSWAGPRRLRSIRCLTHRCALFA